MIKMALCCMVIGTILLAGDAVAGQKPGLTIFRAGEATVTALQDTSGEFSLSLFKGADEQTLRRLAPAGKMASTVNVFLVRHNGKIILVDTGNGLDTPERKSALPALLAEAGVRPGDVDAVLLTHMHGDHIGGLIPKDEAFFPKAEVLVSAEERAFWEAEAGKGAQSAYARNAALAARVFALYGPRARVFSAGQSAVLPGISAFPAQGHTPGHSMFILESGGKRFFFWGDLVHAAALQFAKPEICATYDMDMDGARATRKAIMAKAAGEGVPVAGAHLPYPGVGRVKKGKDGGFIFVPGVK